MSTSMFNSAMKLVILFSLKTMESLRIEVATHFQMTPLISIGIVLLASPQSSHSVDTDAWCKRALTVIFLQPLVSNCYYRPQRSLGQGNIFSSVCQEFCSRGGQVHPRAGTPPSRYTHPPGQVHPPEQCMLGDTGNKRAVHILLDCILVYLCKFMERN